MYTYIVQRNNKTLRYTAFKLNRVIFIERIAPFTEHIISRYNPKKHSKPPTNTPEYNNISSHIYFSNNKFMAICTLCAAIYDCDAASIEYPSSI